MHWRVPGRRVTTAGLLLAGVCAGTLTYALDQRRPDDGPFGGSAAGDRSHLCAHWGSSGSASLGDDALRNRSAHPLTIEQVRLHGDPQLGLGQVLPVLDRTLVGSAGEFPPPGVRDGRAWSRRVPARGAVVQPGEEVNLLAELRGDPGRTATVRYLEVLYGGGGDGFRYRSGLETRLLSAGVSCPRAP